MNTWAFARWPGGPLPRLLEIIRSPRGEKFVIEKNGYVEPALLGTTHHPEYLAQTVLDAYRAPFPTPASRAALLCWSRDIPVSEGDPGNPVALRFPPVLADPVSSPPALQRKAGGLEPNGTLTLNWEDS